MKRSPKSPIGSMENDLLARDFICKERSKFNKECNEGKKNWKDPPRFTYRRGSFRVLTESNDCPWWTIQKLSPNHHVSWFVDFPLDVGRDSIFSFIAANK